MWPVLVEKFNCGFLRNDAGEEVQLILYFLHFLWGVCGVLRCIRKVLIRGSRTNLDLVNVASIG
jgi:hypothetical protein